MIICYVRRLLAFFLLSFFLSVPTALALDAFSPVVELPSNRPTTFSSVRSKHHDLSQNIKSQRRNFEEQGDYTRRISKYKKDLNAFLSLKYHAVFQPDEVILDWENSILKIEITGPGIFLRKRGGASSDGKLKFSVPLSPNRAREIFTFKNSILIDMRFSLTDTAQFLIETLSIQHNGEEIFSE